jgi:hypothetical protein
LERFVEKVTPLVLGLNENMAYFGVVSVKWKYSREGCQPDELSLLGRIARVVEMRVLGLVERENL